MTAVTQGGFGDELATQVPAAAFDDLDSPVERVGAPVAAAPLREPEAGPGPRRGDAHDPRKFG